MECLVNFIYSIHVNCQQVYCEAVTNGGLSREPYQFKVAYDKLVIAAGAEPTTFGIKGVKEHAFFLREVNHAQEIRKRLLLNLMLSENPGVCFISTTIVCINKTIMFVVVIFLPLYQQAYQKKKRNAFYTV